MAYDRLADAYRAPEPYIRGLKASNALQRFRLLWEGGELKGMDPLFARLRALALDGDL
jgi:hypothetical protein